MSAARAQKKRRAKNNSHQTWSGQAYRAFGGLIREGFFKQPNERTIQEVIKALEARGLSTKDKEAHVLCYSRLRTLATV